MTAPPDRAITAALIAASGSPCAKSKRGVAVYVTATGTVIATGYNGQPSGACDGNCRAVCAKVCVHADSRALRRAFAMSIARGVPMSDLDAVHVKLGTDGERVAGGGPSCWQCSREVLDVGLGGFWLYEVQPFNGDGTGGEAKWRRYTAAEFHAATLRACGLEVRT